MKTTIAILLATLLTGCASFNLDMDRKELERQGQPKPYIDGYIAGCASGRSPLNMNYDFTKDVRRFANDGYYQQGWNDGFRVCEADEQRLYRMVRGRR